MPEICAEFLFILGEETEWEGVTILLLSCKATGNASRLLRKESHLLELGVEKDCLFR